MDDGSVHAVEVRYVPPQLSVRIDGRAALTLPLELAATDSASSATAAPATSPYRPAQPSPAAEDAGADAMAAAGQAAVVTVPRTATPIHAAVLDSEGRGFVGFAGASSSIGHEMYELSNWSFRRTLRA
eukprot:84762-Prymnesium_polylepis.1